MKNRAVIGSLLALALVVVRPAAAEEPNAADGLMETTPAAEEEGPSEVRLVLYERLATKSVQLALYGGIGIGMLVASGASLSEPRKAFRLVSDQFEAAWLPMTLVTTFALPFATAGALWATGRWAGRDPSYFTIVAVSVATRSLFLLAGFLYPPLTLLATAAGPWAEIGAAHWSSRRRMALRQTSTGLSAEKTHLQPVVLELVSFRF